MINDYEELRCDLQHALKKLGVDGLLTLVKDEIEEAMVNSEAVALSNTLPAWENALEDLSSVVFNFKENMELLYVENMDDDDRYQLPSDFDIADAMKRGKEW